MFPEPIATYRLQLRPGFGFKEAEALITYMAELGVSHMYLSPCLQAAKDSTHGYDVVDPTKVNAQLGSEESFEQLCEALHKAGLSLLLDIVPNHMAIEGKQNSWWWDVLENGHSSPYALYFDIDWDATEKRWSNKIFLPVLGDHYGRVLENKELQLIHQEGRFELLYQEHTFPIDPSSLTGLLSSAAKISKSEQLAFLAESYAKLPKPTSVARQQIEKRHRDKVVLDDFLVRLCHEDPASVKAINIEVDRLNQSPDALDAFIDQQNYRLAFWRTASRDIGYRRFFDIKDLVGLRIEDKEVFDAAHALPIKWYSKGWVQGLRVDHPDGLSNPEEYFHRLEKACPKAWIVAEKILEYGEKLPPSWNVAGTTGYDFISLVTGLFVDPSSEKALTATYQNVTGRKDEFKVLMHTSKRQVLRDLFGSELNRLTNLWIEICERHRRHRDYTRSELYDALCEVAVYFPVYRSYVTKQKKYVTVEDIQYVETAVELAKREKPNLDPELLDFLKDILLLRTHGELEGELAMRFQQLTGPAMAKGYEDTALYRYNRLVCLNEVGADPSLLGISLEAFHNACVEQQKNYPYTLLASTTHDTKRSEDVRARLALLTEIPDQWDVAVKRWVKLNAKHHNHDLPDSNTEYLLYQTLVGAWPIDEKRLQAYMQKAIREAKEQTSWNTPHKEYEEEIAHFITAIFQDRPFLDDLSNFVSLLVHPGHINSLAQTLLKFTAPGVPDIYQGCELWNFTLVDPDNRQPVDFEERKALLKKIPDLSIEEVLAQEEVGLPKFWLTFQVLQFRAKHPELFGSKGAYTPLNAEGTKAQHVVAFVRGDGAITVVPRLIMGLNQEWGNTILQLPKGLWVNVLTKEVLNESKVSLQKLFSAFPVAFLEKKS